jgi:stage II sporulation protein D
LTLPAAPRTREMPRSPASRGWLRRALVAVATVVSLMGLLPVSAAGRSADRDATAVSGGTAVSGWTAVSDSASLTGTLTFYGRGYGHGVGMSQYGARGRAIAGQDAATILAHYYAGTTTGTIDLNTPIRVLVLSKWASTPTSPFVAYGRSKPWTIDGIDATFPADAKLTLRPTITTTETGTSVSWRLRIVLDGVALLDRTMNHSFRLRTPTSGGRLQIASKPSSFDTYRSVLKIFPSVTAPTVSAVNELRLESYLRGVVPAEMPSSWPGAALAAQAIVARSYAARRLHPATGSYDIGDDSRTQVYRGVLAERSTTTAAILATAGVVLKSGSSIANTLYHSTGGGGTENNENVFVSASGDLVATPVSYLRGSSDRAGDGSSYDAAAPYATWHTASYTVTQLSSWLATDSRTKVGTLTALGLTNRGVSGRLISVTLVGSAGTKKVSADVFRSVFNANRPAADPSLRSTLFDLKPIP